VQLQPGWTQFLEDCRLRLPATHPLNVMTLETTADISVDAEGRVVDISISGSGHPDFDRAVKQVVTDAAPLPKPPIALWSDDNRAHLRWLFARDRRQAGPATAQVVEYLWPLRDAVAKLVVAGDLTRAAKRIKREPVGVGADRDKATTDLMVAGLREALASNDGAVRRAAVEVIGEALVAPLVEEVDQLLVSTSDVELRLAAIATTAAIGEHGVVHGMFQQLKTDIKTDRKVALAEVDALIRLDASGEVATLLRDELTAPKGPNPIALHALGRLAVPAVNAQLAAWQRGNDPRIRAGVCAATIQVPVGVATSLLAKGLRDRDASVRAACLDAVTERMELAKDQAADTFVGSGSIDRVIELVKDRDVLVRAAAIKALAAVQAESPYGDPAPPLHGDGKKTPRKVHIFDPAAFPDLSADNAAEVRVAYMRAITQLSLLRPMEGGRARVVPLLDDRDADVRAAAWDALVALLRRPVDKIEADPPPDDFDRRIARATKDSAATVRLAVIEAITDDVILIRMAGGDDDGEVRTRALVRTVGRSGRAQSTDLLLGRFAAASPGSAERVRDALAWHLAK